MNRNRGFTLIELIIVLIISAVVAAFAVPSFTAITDSNRLTTSANDLVGLLNLARSQAMQRSRLVRVTPLDGTHWSSGLVSWIDTNGDGKYSASDTTLRKLNFNGSQLQLTGSALTGFRGNGLERNSSTVTFTLCDNRTGETGRQVTVSAGGGISTSDFQCP